MSSSTVSLVLGDIVIPSSSVGKILTVEGAYQEGRTFAVTSLRSADGSIDDGKTSGVNVGVTLALGAGDFIGGVNVTLNKIVSDSRCPIDVQCIQAGNVTANITLISDTDKETIEMDSTTPHMFGSYRVTMVNVLPVRKSGANLSPANYRITFTVDKTLR